MPDEAKPPPERPALNPDWHPWGLIGTDHFTKNTHLATVDASGAFSQESVRVPMALAIQLHRLLEPIPETAPEGLPLIDYAGWRDLADGLAVALRLTQEYIGAELLPAIPGWCWYDGLVRYERATGISMVPERERTPLKPPGLPVQSPSPHVDIVTWAVVGELRYQAAVLAARAASLRQALPGDERPSYVHTGMATAMDSAAAELLQRAEELVAAARAHGEASRYPGAPTTGDWATRRQYLVEPDIEAAVEEAARPRQRHFEDADARAAREATRREPEDMPELQGQWRPGDDRIEIVHGTTQSRGGGPRYRVDLEDGTAWRLVQGPVAPERPGSAVLVQARGGQQRHVPLSAWDAWPEEGEPREPVERMYFEPPGDS